MRKLPVGPRITPYAREFYQLAFGKVNSGCQFALESFVDSYRRALGEMSGMFTYREKYTIYCICERINFKYLRPGEWLLTAAQRDVDRLTELTAILHPQVLVDKLARLPELHRAMLVMWAHRNLHADNNRKPRIWAELAGCDEPAKNGAVSLR